MTAIKRWIKSLFYVPKYAKVSDKSFSRIMFFSVFGILICGICLAGLTWAWFSSNVTSTANHITAADFSVRVEVKQSESVIVPENENGSYKLNSGDYTVTVTAGGSATTGYCKVTLDQISYHTVQLYPTGGDGRPQSVTFTVNASGDSDLTITPQWGTYAKPENEELIGNSKDDIKVLPNQPLSLLEAETDETEKPDETQTYHLTESEQSYTVQQGDTLSKIADRYGTTVAVLSAYNNIQNVGDIQAGTTMKIPPASYTIPETTTTQPTVTAGTTTAPTVTTAPTTTASSQQTTDTSSTVSETVSTEASSEETEPTAASTTEPSDTLYTTPVV